MKHGGRHDACLARGDALRKVFYRPGTRQQRLLTWKLDFESVEPELLNQTHAKNPAPGSPADELSSRPPGGVGPYSQPTETIA